MSIFLLQLISVAIAANPAVPEKFEANCFIENAPASDPYVACSDVGDEFSSDQNVVTFYFGDHICCSF